MEWNGPGCCGTAVVEGSPRVWMSVCVCVVCERAREVEVEVE